MTSWVPRPAPRRPPHRGWAIPVVLLLAVASAMPVAAPAGELRVGLPRLPVALDPATGVTPSEFAVLRLCFEGLVTTNERGEIEPALASQWTLSRDGLTWTFRLREGVQLWNGTALAVDDVLAALARHLSSEEPPESAPPWVRLVRGGTRVVREIRRGDAGTIEVQLGQPYAPLLALLAHPALAIAVPWSEEAASAGPSAKPEATGRWLGTGPYRPVEHAPGRLVLEAVPGGRTPPKSDRLVLLEVPDEPTGLTDLGPGGKLDLLIPQSPPPAALPGLQVLTGPSWQVGWLAFRTDQGLFRQKAGRQAAAFALDPASIQAALGRWAVPMSGYLPPGAWAARDALRPFDLARARRLVTQLGTSSPAVTLLAPESAAGLADAIRASLAAAGIKVRVRAEPADPVAAAIRRGEGDLALFEAPLVADDPHFLLRPLLASDGATPGSATNVAFYRNPLVDGMLSRASQLGFRPERLRLYQRLQALLAEELPYVPLYSRLQWLVARPEVRDARLEPSGIHRLERVWVEASPAPPPVSVPMPPPAADSPAAPAPAPPATSP